MLKPSRTYLLFAWFLSVEPYLHLYISLIRYLSSFGRFIPSLNLLLLSDMATKANSVTYPTVVEVIPSPLAPVLSLTPRPGRSVHVSALLRYLTRLFEANAEFSSADQQKVSLPYALPLDAVARRT
jgi:hypothetical protein